MKRIGFVISHKNNEKRRALLPKDVANIKYPKQLYFEKGYGESIGFSDEEYSRYGCKIVSREEALRCDIICDVKLGDAEYLNDIGTGKMLFGWAHAVQGIEFTDGVLKNDNTVLAWEEIFESGRYIFYRNREVAGEAAILQAYRYCGKMPYDTKVAVLGNGQTAKGALRILHGLGAVVDVYGRKLENLFKQKMYEYDVIVNCVMWDTGRSDRIIYKEDLKKFKKGSMIIDVSCDPYLEIETSHPTTIDDPVYEVDGVIHYAVDNTPAMYPITVSNVLSEGISKYIDVLVDCDIDKYPECLKNAIVINAGHIIDNRITEFRKKRNLFCK